MWIWQCRDRSGGAGNLRRTNLTLTFGSDTLDVGLDARGNAKFVISVIASLDAPCNENFNVHSQRERQSRGRQRRLGVVYRHKSRIGPFYCTGGLVFDCFLAEGDVLC